MTAETCQCATYLNVAKPEHRQHPCNRAIEKKYVLCRPCAKNWHDGTCDTYYREPIWHLVRTCARCGHDSALHDIKETHWWHELEGMPMASKIEQFRETQTVVDLLNGPTGFTMLTAQEFKDTGLLFAVNEFVLWPLGIALSVVGDKDGGFIGYRAIRLVEPETMVQGDIDLAAEPDGKHPLKRFLEFAEHRISQMDPEEQKLAKARLRGVVHGD